MIKKPTKGSYGGTDKGGSKGTIDIPAKKGHMGLWGDKGIGKSKLKGGGIDSPGRKGDKGLKSYMGKAKSAPAPRD